MKIDSQIRSTTMKPLGIKTLGYSGALMASHTHSFSQGVPRSPLRKWLGRQLPELWVMRYINMNDNKMEHV